MLVFEVKALLSSIGLFWLDKSARVQALQIRVNLNPAHLGQRSH